MAAQRCHTPGLLVVVVYNGLSLFEFGCVVEIFGLARPELGDGWYRFMTCASETGPLRSSAGVEVRADGGLELLSDAQTIVIPGWRGPHAPVPEPLRLALIKAHQRGARIASICTGAFVLASCGLLSRKSATTHWRHLDTLRTLYPDVLVERDALYVDNGNVLTSAGSAAGIDLCLHIIRRDLGTSIANMVARRLVSPPHRQGGQAQYFEAPVPIHSHSSLWPLLDDMHQNLHLSWSIANMAAKVGMSTRTFQRRFIDAIGVPPGEWLLALRIQKVKDLLEETTLSIEKVCERSGFQNTATLRVQFRNRVGVSPSRYRQVFGSMEKPPSLSNALKTAAA